jgi:hypothetical protein
VELYLHFPNTSSWRGAYLTTGATLPCLYFNYFGTNTTQQNFITMATEMSFIRELSLFREVCQESSLTENLNAESVYKT